MTEAHSYEEIRDVVIDILLEKEKPRHPPEQFVVLVLAVGWVFAKRRAAALDERFDPGRDYNPHAADAELIRDVFSGIYSPGTYYPWIERTQ